MSNIIKTTLMTVLLFSAQNGFSFRIPAWLLPQEQTPTEAEIEISELKKTVTEADRRVNKVNRKVNEVLRILNKTQPMMTPVVDLTEDEVVAAEALSPVVGDKTQFEAAPVQITPPKANQDMSAFNTQTYGGTVAILPQEDTPISSTNFLNAPTRNTKTPVSWASVVSNTSWFTAPSEKMAATIDSDMSEADDVDTTDVLDINDESINHYNRILELRTYVNHCQRQIWRLENSYSKLQNDYQNIIRERDKAIKARAKAEFLYSSLSQSIHTVIGHDRTTVMQIFSGVPKYCPTPPEQEDA